jgi:hypothetical protein
MERLAPQFLFHNDGAPATISGRNSLDTFGEWTVCAFLTGGSNEFQRPDVYAVGTIDVTRACTDARSALSRAAAKVRSARSALRRAKGSAAKRRASALLRKRQGQFRAARRDRAARLARDCPYE